MSVKTILTLLVVVGIGISNTRAQVLPVAGAVTGALLTKDKSVGTQIAAAAGLATVMTFTDKVLKDKRARADFQKMQLGRYQEAWIRAATDWHNSTMDRRSGLPPAFDGYWAMYAGVPEAERPFVQQRLQMPQAYVPADRDTYLEYLSLQATGATEQRRAESSTLEVPTTAAVMPERTVNGVRYRAQVREFPTLPN